MIDNGASANNGRPWSAEQSDNGDVRIRDAAGAEIARMAAGIENGLSNAALMAAAPELLAAVKAFQTFYLDVLPLLEQHMAPGAGGNEHIEIPDHPAVTRAKLAVAKAERTT